MGNDMKLKSIIVENNKKLKKLNQLLQTKFKNDSRVLLYRQTDTEIDEWEVRRIKGGQRTHWCFLRNSNFVW